MIWSDEKLIEVLLGGGVAVMPTDTIYGIVGSAFNESTVGRIYTLRKRNPEKPCIVLIGDISELEKFSINLTGEQRQKLEEYWQQDSLPVSIILDCEEDKFAYLHRGTHTLAFRVPHKQELRELLLKTGPLIAPSANIEGLAPSTNIPEARNYFGDSVDLYVDGGDVEGNASKVIKVDKDGTVSVLRE